MSAILDLQNICCRYTEGDNIINGLSFSLERGEFCGIIGPNGAGKTTLFRMISGYMAASSGRIMLNGKEIRDYRDTERAAIMAIVPQQVMVPAPYTVREIVSMGRTSRLSAFAFSGQDDRAKVAEAMERMDVARYQDRLFNHLSGGERQRVMIAMALAQEPEILLLDEPTSQLDLGNSAHLMGLLSGLNRERGLTILLISHDIQLISSYCARIILLKDGQILTDGQPDKVLNADLIRQAYGCEVEIISCPGQGCLVSVCKQDFPEPACKSGLK